MSEPVFMFDGSDQRMKRAYEEAQHSFKFFWRELSWERRRIVPGLDMAMIKLPFTDGPRSDGKSEFEHMWADEVEFDGNLLKGRLLNSPNWLTSVKKGDAVERPFSHLTDWMMTANGRAYGGYTVNLMRANMSSRERQEHDQAWGLEFGDPNDVRAEIDFRGKEKTGLFAKLFGGRAKAPEVKEGFKDHPMCINMLQKFEAQLREDPSIGCSPDEFGWTLLHREALAGNLGVVQLLLRHGADIEATTATGQKASDLARLIGWAEIASYLDQERKG